MNRLNHVGWVFILIMSLAGCELQRADTSGDIKALVPDAGAQTNALVWIEPVTQQINAGGTTTVEIRVRDVVDLAAVDLEVRFEPTMLQVIDADPGQAGVQIQPGDFLSADFVVTNSVDNVQGILRFVVSQVAPTPAVSGQGLVALILFEGLLPGIAEITITQVQLADSAARPIPVTPVSGQIDVLSGVDLRTPTPSAETSPPPESTATPVLTVTATITSTVVMTQPAPTVEPAAPTPEPLPQTKLATPVPDSAVVIEAPSPTPAPATGVVIPQGATLGFCYTVQPGDTLPGLAQNYGTDPKFISIVNDLNPPGHIYQNQTLFVPTSYGRGPNVYIYTAGGALDFVASECKLPVKMLARYNNLAEGAVLEANYPLIIPIPPFPPPSRYAYPLPIVPIPPPPTCCGP